jgi:type IV pilus assembly protein PilB
MTTDSVLQLDPLLQLVHEQDLFDAAQIETMQAEHEETERPVRRIILDGGYMQEDDLLELMAAHYGTRAINLPATDIPIDVIHTVPASVARMYNCVPVDAPANSVELAVCDLVNPQVMDELMFVLTRDVSVVFAREEDVKASINQFYGDDSDAVSEMLSALVDTDIEEISGAMLGENDEAGLEDAAGAKPVVQFVNLVLFQAANDRASDIHFEPFEKEFKIRYRVDGSLYEMAPPPKRLALPIISRIKVMASLNIAERRLPQDGRIQLSVAGRMVDLRVSTLPTQFGESCVLRVLDRSVVALDLENIGMPEDVYENFVLDIAKPNGILVVTGPTGSGKTTTLYSGLRRINTIDRKLLTAEEPVEYDVEGIMQVPINESTGNTFPRVLRAFLRQDPDVIMVGEVRDMETAQIAIQASLTGHLVFSTLHTNDAAGAITRLIDMGIAPYLISSTLEAVLAQRLTRTVCEKCKTPYTPDEEVMQSLGVTEKDVGNREFFYGAGCPFCNETGYHGRKGLYEYLSVSPPVKELINEMKPTLIIRAKAIELGMRTLREDGIRNVLDGYTTVDEVVKYT